MAPFWHRWSDFSILNLSVFHLTDKCFAISNLINLLDTLSTTEIKIKMLPGNLTPTGDWVPDNARVEQEINDMFPPVPEDTAEE